MGPVPTLEDWITVMSAPLRPHAATGRPLTVGLIGAGRTGPVLGAALTAAGHRVTAVTARSPESRARVAAMLPSATILPADDVARAAADLLLVAVPDDNLAPLVDRLAAGVLRSGQVVAHTSGAHGIAVLAPATARGVRPLALHPAMTFTGEAADLDRLPGISYGVTAPDELRPLATQLVADLGGYPEWVAEPHRPLYHAALAHGANHLITLVNEAADWLRDAGVTDPASLLRPLLAAALDNALARGDGALTGPVARGDAGTIAGHLAVLAIEAPDSVAAYRALAHRTVDRAITAGLLSPAAAGPLLDALTDPALLRESA
jgi:predicted short-subunit dehydrogenase-like oxidoreductase (DUF2520 family)